VVVVGPGLLGRASTGELLERLLPRIEQARVVLDAVALSALGEHRHLAGSLEGRLVLTPNSGELAALRGDDDDDLPLPALAERYGAVVSTGGEVVTPDGRRWVDEAGGIGLGTSGSGDVLAGVVGGLLARGCTPEQAAVWGQYVHAGAGDRLAGQLGRTGFLARELLDELVPVLSGLNA
ncbi:MAG: NAD(P)H-hydrate dehydratase, partial [Actinomycetota bacterium]|nr:NAD(P)H-hydrate dehydratase [Actinomycetota bacterium]